MDKLTREYRIKELNKIDYVTGEYCPTIKIQGENNQATKTLNLSWSEFEAIKTILTA